MEISEFKVWDRVEMYKKKRKWSHEESKYVAWQVWEIIDIDNGYSKLTIYIKFDEKIKLNNQYAWWVSHHDIKRKIDIDTVEIIDTVKIDAKEDKEVYTQEDLLIDFRKRLDSLFEIVKKKNSDYSSKEDPFKNFKLVELMGIASAEEGILVRKSDKFARIVNLIKNKDQQVTDESIQDTLMDDAAYSILLAILITNK